MSTTAAALCEICRRPIAENAPLYSCEVCDQNHCEDCGDSWSGDDEDDATFAGMYLECVCEHCLNDGFVPPETARRDHKFDPKPDTTK